MTKENMNKHQWRQQMAMEIFISCNGDIDKAMKHGKMPYKKRSTVMKLAKENNWYSNINIKRPRSGALTNEEIEKIHQIFIKNNGSITKTAKLSGFSKSTVSRYAKTENWHQELLEISKENLDEETNSNGRKYPITEDSDEETDNTILRLKALRKMLFEKITGERASGSSTQINLNLEPKTLSEAIKALIDIDKRISDREDNKNSKNTDPYRNILAKCADIKDDKA
ncbi:hypothetical protein GF312_02045 [Candidatus Poribacteria bacterium]|nr:hypothetical protein [Candidatus Poribacteria bacterium]